MEMDKGIEDHCISMAALGRCFKLGDLYDYRNDKIIKDYSLEGNLIRNELYQCENVFHRELIHTGSSTENHKWGELGEHLQVSIVTGLIENEYRGASNYLNDRQDSQQITWTLIFRAKTRKEMFRRLPIEWLIDDSSNEDDKKNEKSEATHIVAGIVYGAEAYCVLAQDFHGDERDQEAREEAKENLCNLANTLAKSLVNGHNVSDFLEQFDKDEKKRLGRINCRFYADILFQTVRHFGLFDAYFQCLKLIRKIQFDNVPQLGQTGCAPCQAVPISVFLCPLRLRPKVTYDKIINTDHEGNSSTSIINYNLQLPIILEELPEYRDIEIGLANRCCQIWTRLQRLKVDIIRRATGKKISPSAPLRLFCAAVNQYKELLRWSLKNGVMMARESASANSKDEEIKRVLDIAEGHQLFQPSQLEKWIGYKQSELEVTEIISAVKAITFVPSRKLMETKLTISLDKKFTLVLFVPSLDDKSNEILRMMQDYLENNTSLLEINRQGDDEDDALPWHMVPRKRKEIFDEIRAMADHVGKNKHLENQVQFFITLDDPGNKDFSCHYSVYEGETLLKGELCQLPGPPTGLRIHPASDTGRASSRICVAWDYDDLGYPFQFLVEHRSTLQQICNSWIQRKRYINFQKGSLLGIRVAVETCVGRSDFTEVLDTEIPVDDCLYSDIIDMKLSKEFKCLEMIKNVYSRDNYRESIAIGSEERIVNSSYEDDGYNQTTCTDVDDDASLTSATTDCFWDCLESS